jgi:hypothetical protein
MAGLKCAQPFDQINGVATAYKTIWQLKAPTNQRVKLTAFRLGCMGVVTTDPPVLVRLLLQTTAGTGGTAGTPVLTDRDASETIQSTTLLGPASGTWAATGGGTGAEPTASTIFYTDSIHPQGRIPEMFFQPEMWLKGGERVGLMVNVGSGAVNGFVGTIFWEE